MDRGAVKYISDLTNIKFQFDICNIRLYAKTLGFWHIQGEMKKLQPTSDCCHYLSACPTADRFMPLTADYIVYKLANHFGGSCLAEKVIVMEFKRQSVPQLRIHPRTCPISGVRAKIIIILLSSSLYSNFFNLCKLAALIFCCFQLRTNWSLFLSNFAKFNSKFRELAQVVHYLNYFAC